MDALLFSVDVKFLLSQRREAKFVIASFLWVLIAVHSKSKWVSKGDCYPEDWREYWDVSVFYFYGDTKQDFDWYQSSLSNYDESTQKLNIKIEYKYMQSNIFIVSAGYLFRYFYHISFSKNKEIAKKKKVSAGGRVVTIFYFTQSVDRKQTTF